jgi:hypothetical protein
MRQDLELLEELKDFVKKRTPELAAIVFLEARVTLYWKVEDIVSYLLNHRQYKNKKNLKSSKTSKTIKKLKIKIKNMRLKKDFN